MQKTLNPHVRRTVMALILAGIMLLTFSGLSLVSVVRAQADAAPVLNSNPAQDGSGVSDLIIDSPPYPPPGYQAQDLASMLALKSMSGGYKNLDVPAYRWDYGCSATSASMIAAYYDRNGYSNMYSGPTNGGVMPMTSSPWVDYTDTKGYTIAQIPLAASRNGLDGRTIRGSIDDYWVSYYNPNPSTPYPDPFSGNWSEHIYGSAIGDYMRTSQLAFGNTDGMTHFYEYSSSSTLPCSAMPDGDGTLGRKLFYVARGYTVTDCYSQRTDNQVSGGFSFAQYMAEIDAGRPVLINVTGHSMVGTGYDSSTQTIYLHNTWDYTTDSMPWGGSYQGMALQAVSIVNLASAGPGAFNKLAPANGATAQPSSLSLSWAASSGAASYQYCIDTSNNDTCNATWKSTAANTQVVLSVLAPSTTYYWQARALNSSANTLADGGTWWSFTTAAFPGAFDKIAPANGATAQPASLTLSWAASSGTTQYSICYNTSATCSSWINVGTATSKVLSTLLPGTTYYWNVKAVNGAGTKFANGGWWSFTTAAYPGPFNKTAPANGATGQSNNPTLTWEAGSGATKYWVCYNTSATCASWIDVGTDTSKPLTGLLPGTTYYWQVKAVNAAGTKFSNGGWWSFTTGP